MLVVLVLTVEDGWGRANYIVCEHTYNYAMMLLQYVLSKEEGVQGHCELTVGLMVSLKASLEISRTLLLRNTPKLVVQLVRKV